MSKNIEKIERALSELGLIPIHIIWGHWSTTCETQGIEGGWFVIAIDPLIDKEYEFLELNIEGLLREIYRYPMRYYPKDLEYLEVF